MTIETKMCKPVNYLSLISLYSQVEEYKNLEEFTDACHYDSDLKLSVDDLLNKASICVKYQQVEGIVDVLKKRMDEIELMQSTGLVDREGVEIYEGDIVKIPDDYKIFGKNAGEMCKVIFDSGCFRLKTSYGRGRGFWFEDDSTVTIIGNIYENPELWEEEK